MDALDKPVDSKRRVFIKGLGYVSASLVMATMFGGCEKIIKQIKERPVRRRLRTGSTLVDNDIAIYRDAVAQMRALPASNPRSWAAQAGLHGTVSGGFNFCQHGTDHFFSWHRAYLLYFERICQELTGEKKFGLPYWNWNQDPAIHSAFLDSSSALYDGTRVVTTVAGGSSFTDDTLDPIFEDNNFFTFGSQIEGTPHNSAHSTIRGNMVTGGSPLDPIFWAHHCMVDYCWAKWNIELDNDNTNDSAWQNTSWNHFVDGAGNPAEITAGLTTILPLLSYQYEPSTIGSSSSGLSIDALSAGDFKKMQKRMRDGIEVKFDIKRVVPISNQKRIFLSRPISLRSDVSVNDFSAIVEANKQSDRVFVRVKYAQSPPTNDFFVRVFINKPNANSKTPDTDIHYAGSFAFFGTHTGHHDGKHQHKTEYLVNVTDTLKELRQKGVLRSGEAVSVELVAVPTSAQFTTPQAEFALESIDFIVSPVTIKSR